MTGVLWMVGVAVVLVALYALRPSAIDRAAQRAIAKKDVAPLVEQVQRSSEEQRATAFNKAVKALWDSYERPLAIELIKRLASRVSQASITQYWIRQVLEVEPELAESSFDAEFLVAYYRPEVAAQCGKVG